MIITLQTLLFFRESLLKALDSFLRPYFTKLRLSLSFSSVKDDAEEDDEDQVFADFDEEKGVVFYPPMYVQRYAAVTDCLMDERWCGQLEKVVDLGYHDMTFIKYLKDVPGVCHILGVDIEALPLRCSSDLLQIDEYGPKRETPLQVQLFQGNAADPDYRLVGCDAVVAIEMIEHMLPHDLERLVHTVFGFIKPWIAIFTTPNGDFNELFHSLERNGYRRLDHFFEWSRQQFHDWCSNIVVRYPNYTVSCKGIGPGPNGTRHLGCCSQLALFVSNDYHKQDDLTLESLSLVSKMPNLCDNVSTWMSQGDGNGVVPKMIENNGGMESYSQIMYREQQSCMTIMFTSPSYMDTLVYRDNTCQCNLDTECGKNFLMFNEEELCVTVLVPRKKSRNRVYFMEDVASRLNCTTVQVKKFSKLTQGMIARHKSDSYVHTRDVVGEIQHLTKMLNFNQEPPEERGGAWKNFNWGDNAPYWNQYYQVVREYNYPFENKSEECRIVELISEEMHRVGGGGAVRGAGSPGGAGGAGYAIPLPRLMCAVRHITEDIDKVRDLLEWNGYDVTDDSVQYTRLAPDELSTVTHDVDWKEEPVSDWDVTATRSPSTLSAGSTVVPDYNVVTTDDVLGSAVNQDHSFRRVLEQKVNNLRTMLTADKDITTELDRVVCRLMRVALKTCRDKQTPPTAKWMQYKLLDLLTLTEKAVERRNRRCIENYTLNAIAFGNEVIKKSNLQMLAIQKVKDDNNTTLQIMDKYKQLAQDSSDNCDLDNSFPCDDDDSEYDHTSNEYLNDFSYLEDNKCLDFLPTSIKPEKDTSKEIILKTKAYIVATSEKSSEDVLRNDRLSGKRLRKESKKPKPVNVKEDDSKPRKVRSKSDKNSERSVKSRRRWIRSKMSDASDEEPCSCIKLRRTCQCTVDEGVQTPRLPSMKRMEYNRLVMRDLTKSPHDFLNQLPKLKFGSSASGSPRYISPDRILFNKAISSSSAVIRKRLSSTSGDLTPGQMSPSLQYTNKSVSEAMSSSSHFDDLIKSASSSVKSRAAVVPHARPTWVLNAATIKDLPDVIASSQDSVAKFLKVDETTESKQAIPQTSADDNLTAAKPAIQSHSSILEASDEKISETKLPDVDLFHPEELGDPTNDKKFTTTTQNYIPLTNTVNQILIERSSYSSLLRKLSSKKSNNSMSSKNCSGKLNSVKSKRKFKEHQNLQSTSSKPIPESLIQLCHPELLTEKKITYPNKNKERTNDVSTTEESLLIDIVMDDTEETIALRRTIGTDAVTELPTREYDTLLGGIVNVMNADSFHNRETVPNENMQSQTIFLNDINEPSTSKGIRHVTTDVQCGPDPVLSTFAALSPAGSVSKASNIFASGLKIGDSTTKIKGNKGNTDFGTSMDDKKDYSGIRTPRNRPAGIVIRDSCSDIVRAIEELNEKQKTQVNKENEIESNNTSFISESVINEVQFKSDDVSNCDVSQKDLPNKNDYKGGKEIIQAGETSQSLVKKPSPTETNEKTIIQNKNMKEVGQTFHQTKYVRPTLTCGGVQVHCYREKQISEDIVYLGRWQSPKMKAPPRKKPYKTVLAKKDSITKRNKVNSKEKMISHGGERKELKKSSTVSQNFLSKSPLPIRNIIVSPKKQESVSKVHTNQRKSAPDRFVSSNRSIKVLTKCPSKISSATVKKTIVHPAKVDTKEADKVQSKRSKSYIPLYLKKRAHDIKAHSDTLNKSCDSVEATIKGKIKPVEISPLIRAKTEEIRKDLIKFQENLKKNVNYFIFRNEVQNTSSGIESNSHDSNNRSFRSRDKNTHRSYSPTSSNCSSPNSVATVKPSRGKPVSNKKLSTSSNKSHSENSENDDAPPKNKYTYKRLRNLKKSDKNVDNKENVPETSKKNNRKAKDAEKSIKGGFSGRSKNLIVGQAANDGTNAAPTVIMKSSSKASPRIPVYENMDVKKREGDVNISQQTSLKSHNSLINDESSCDSISANSLETKNRQCSTTLKVTDWIDHCGLHHTSTPTQIQKFRCTTSDIFIGVRQLIEDSLNFIDNIEEDTFDSKTVILHDEEVKNKNLEDLASETSASVDTVIDKRETNSTSPLEQSLDSTPSLTFTDMSFKSTTSMTRLSESSLVDNISPQDSVSRTRTNSVRDIFERKEQLKIPNVMGNPTLQAFSGFSMNMETLPGDQPDFVNLVNSNTENLAVPRQATSEELFISGRSSLTFESCVVDEDIVVPDWLFQILSQAQSSTYEDTDSEGFLSPEVIVRPESAMPLEQPPQFELMGPAPEPGLGVGAGAGDGCGMHSDHSEQDSSGRGTSLSSSATSSENHSEAILIDPSAFMAQYELYHEPDNRSAAPALTVAPPNDGPNPEASVLTSSRELARTLAAAASDADADVSSLDTDVPDSSTE